MMLGYGRVLMLLGVLLVEPLIKGGGRIERKSRWEGKIRDGKRNGEEKHTFHNEEFFNPSWDIEITGISALMRQFRMDFSSKHAWIHGTIGNLRYCVDSVFQISPVSTPPSDFVYFGTGGGQGGLIVREEAKEK